MKINKELFEKYGFKVLDSMEMKRGEGQVTVAYPRPAKRFKLIYETYSKSIEQIYFWVLTHIREDWGMHEVEKIKDIFTASEQSSVWGAAQQRLQLQQQQASQYLGTIANMVKGMFAIVREIRLIKEKLTAYKQADGGDEAAEVLLKGYWVDLKDGGTKNPTSVYGMATQVGFAILPDLFFSTPLMKNSNEVDKHVKRLSSEFNRKVCEVLARKLKAYMYWRENTSKELSARHNFTIKYLRQHYDTIQMYMSWVKPYLMNIKRLQMNQDKSASVDLIGAFEGSTIEIEFMCHRESTKSHHAVVLVTMDYRTRPTMDFHTEGYQHKGPIHVGRVEMTMRTYAWTPQQINDYKQMKEEESMAILSSIDSSIKEAMQGLGDELRDYLKEAGEKFPEDIKKEKDAKKNAEKLAKELKKKQSMLEPFLAVGGGFKDIFHTVVPKDSMDSIFSMKSASADQYKINKNIQKAAGEAQFVLWQTYKNFKGVFGMVKW